MRLIMFDMDGTLVNSSKAIINTVNYVRENLGFETLENNYILENLNDPNINTSEFFYGTKDFTKEQAVLFEEYYDKNCLLELEVYNGIKRLLEDLKNDFTLCVATNANSNFAEKMLKHVELEKYFSSIFGYDSVKNPKPHPEMVEKILDKHNVINTNAQMIGDSHKDTIAASKAGVDSVLVNWGFSNHKKDAIQTIQELEEAISDKFKK